MKINYGSQQDEVRIEIIPLIDVIFCILTFFILAAVALTRQSAINASLPSASTGVPQMRETLLVTVDPVGQIYIDKTPVTQEQLLKALQEFQVSQPQGVMVLNAPPYASYNDVIQVLDLLRSVGGDRVALAVQPKPAGQTEGQTPGQLPNAEEGIEGQTTPLDPFGLPSVPNDPISPVSPINPTNPERQPLPGVDSPTTSPRSTRSPAASPRP